jgi:hypothetical protein
MHRRGRAVAPPVVFVPRTGWLPNRELARMNANGKCLVILHPLFSVRYFFHWGVTVHTGTARGVRRNARCAGLPSRPPAQHWGVMAHAMTQTERRVCSCCYFLWKKVTKELCEILTHDALSTPRAESFGGVNDEQSHRVLHAHRNFTPSSASALRTPPKISRGAGSCCSACWCRGVVHDTPEKGNRRRVVILGEAKNPERVAAYCHVLQDVD